MGLCLSLGKGERRPSPITPVVPAAPWPDLPPDLAGSILSLLPSHLDCLSFRAACREWRLAARRQGQDPSSLPEPLPWLRVLDLTSNRGGLTFQALPGGDLLLLTDPDLYASAACVGCVAPGGWLLCDRYNSNGTRTRFLANPFSGSTVDTPPARFGGCVEAHGVGLGSARFRMRKMLACSPDLLAASLSGSAVGFYPPGSPSWSVCPPDPRRGWYTDIAFHRGRLYALSADWDLFVHDAPDAAASGKSAWSAASRVERVINAMQAPETADPAGGELVVTRISYLVAASCDEKLCMVKLSSPLALVNGASDKAIKKVVVKVFEADLAVGRWSEVKNLGHGQALFVGRGCSKAVGMASSRDPRFQGNRVYFLGADLAICCRELKVGDVPSCCFYDLSHGTIGQIFLDGNGNGKHLYPSEWFFPCL